MTYAQATGEEVTDADGTNANKLANFSETFIANGSTQDVYVPTFNASHADTQVIAAGNKIQLKFSEHIAALASASTVKNQFAVLVNGSSATFDSIALNSSDSSIVELTLATA